MIEAVNSVVVNAPLLRGNADQIQQNRLNAFASSNTERVELALAPYVSPFIQMDTNFNKAVLQLRDADTGDVVNQFPSETTMRARAAQAEIQTQSVALQGDSGKSLGKVDSPRVAEIPVASGFESGGSSRVAESQIASAALAAGSLSSGQVASSVSVVA